MYIVIVGGGRLGYFLTTRLLKDKHEVVVIDRDPHVCDRLSSELNFLVIEGDGTDPHVLHEARIDKADVFVALLPQDQDNIIACQISRHEFRIKRTIARVNDPQKTALYTKLGIDVPVDATSIVAQIVEEEASFNDFINLMSIRKGRVALVRVDMPETSPVIRKKIKQLKLPLQSVLVSILRGNDVIIPKGDTELLPGDEVIALTSLENQNVIVNYLMGKL